MLHTAHRKVSKYLEWLQLLSFQKSCEAEINRHVFFFHNRKCLMFSSSNFEEVNKT